MKVPMSWFNDYTDVSGISAKEYNEALLQNCDFNLQPTCEQKCVNCGVCKNLKTHKVLAKPYIASKEAQEILNSRGFITEATVKPGDCLKYVKDLNGWNIKQQNPFMTTDNLYAVKVIDLR